MCGVGIKDIKIGKQEFIDKTLLSRQYYLWKSMLTRCYGEKQRYKSYKGCRVCQRWHTFSNFVEDLPKLPNYELWKNSPNSGISIDKDIIGCYHAYYAPQYCMFVTRSENSKEARQRHKNEIIVPKEFWKKIEKQKRPVIAVNKKSGLILEFISITEAAEAIGGYISNICDVLNGKMKSSKGYYFYDYSEYKEGVA